MSKECSHGHCEKPWLPPRWLLIGVVAFVVATLFFIFLFWLITMPTKPAFVLQDATVYAFNLSCLSSPAILTVNLQVTISAQNRNQRIGMYNEKVDVFASYRNQQITPATMLPATYQGHKDVNVWSPFLCGNAMPLAPFAAAALTEDLNTGMVLLNIKINGKIKWKVGIWISGEYPLNVNCPAYITFGEKCKGIALNNCAAMKFQFVQRCIVDI